MNISKKFSRFDPVSNFPTFLYFYIHFMYIYTNDKWNVRDILNFIVKFHLTFHLTSVLLSLSKKSAAINHDRILFFKSRLNLADND